MAIEVTTFNYPTVPKSNIDEVYDWLVANVSEYFPGGIVKDTQQWRILCYQVENDVHGIAVIPFFANNQSDAGYVYTKYGTDVITIHPNGSSTNTNGYNKAAKTNCGFVLCANSNGATWFFSRTNTGTVCIVASSANAYNVTALRMVLTDLGGDREAIIRGGHSTMYELHEAFRLKKEMDITAMVPVCYNCGSYTDDLLYMPFTQTEFDGGLKTVLIDGQEYVCDGLFALKG